MYFAKVAEEFETSRDCGGCNKTRLVAEVSPTKRDSQKYIRDIDHLGDTAHRGSNDAGRRNSGAKCNSTPWGLSGVGSKLTDG